MIITPAQTWEDLAPLSNDERRTTWAQAFYGSGMHRLSLTNARLGDSLDRALGRQREAFRGEYERMEAATSAFELATNENPTDEG